ncbi:MAG: hypothetical protein AABM66_04570 [Actinomycetota bacterium]
MDQVVLAAYGWGDLVLADKRAINRRLYELNQSIATGNAEYPGPEA